MSDADLWIVLLTGGGLAFIGTVAGVLVTQAFTLRLVREERREQRRVAVKSFQRDTLVALQENVVQLFETGAAVRRNVRYPSDGEDSDRSRVVAEYNLSGMRLRLLASRVRDRELRAAVDDLLDAHEAILGQGDDEMREGMRGEGEEWRAGEEPPTLIERPKSPMDVQTEAMELIQDRAGELIRTLDAIDEAPD